MRNFPRAKRPNAFSLVEVVLALGVATFGLLAVTGMLLVGLTNNQASIQQTAAINLATQIIADLRQAPSAAAIASGSGLSAKSPKYAIDTTGTGSTIYLDESGLVQAGPTDSRFKAVIALTQPASGQRGATYGSVTLSWPAPASIPLGTVTVFVALDRN
jgi:type II secretory pathway pseudopilin PulG